MSNPFALFRKNQKTWMAALVALALLAFVVAPAIQSISGAGGGAAGNNPVVIRWNSGTITAQELSVYARRLGMVESFLNKLAKKVVDAGGEPGVPGIVNPQTRQVQRYGFFRSGSLQTIGQTKLLANYARENGLELSDAAADEFLSAFCDRKISDDDIRQTMVEASNNQLSFYEVREVLKTELAALLLQQNAITGVYTSTPGSLYEDFARMNRTARVEAYPILASSFVGDVSGEPTESELQAIYDEGILRVASPNSSSPGFIKPYSANVEFIRVDFDKRVEEAKAALSEEEIKAEYDRMIALNQLQVPVQPEPAGGTPEAEGNGAEGNGAEGNGAEGNGAEGNGADENTGGENNAEAPMPAPQTSTEESAKPAAEESTEPPAAESPAAEQPAEESAPAGKPENEGTNGSGDQASSEKPSSVKFVAFQGEATPPPVVSPPPLDPDAQGEAKPAESTPATETPASLPPTAEGEVTGSESDETPALPEMRNQTFEEAKEQIALSLARQAATQKVDDIFTDIRENYLLPYALEYQEYEVLSSDEVASAGGAVAPPERPDLKKLAEENGMEYGETGVLNASEASSTEIGQAQVKPDINLMLFGPVSNTVFTIGSQFSPKVNLFQPIQAGNQGNLIQFMFWKTDERPAYQPELADIREEVVEFWRLKQAREKAKKAAEELAAKVKPDEGEPWKGVLSTAELTLVTTTDPFTAIRPTQFGVIPAPVDRLDNVGEEFMDVVFETEVGQFAVAPNSSNDTYYVFRVTEIGPTSQELLDRFNNDPLKSAPKAMARETGAEIFTGWIDAIEKEMGAEWQADGLAAIN